MAKTIKLFRRKNGQLSPQNDGNSDEVFLLRMSGEKDLLAAVQLNVKLQTFEVVTKNKQEQVTQQVQGIIGENRDALRPTKVRINKAAYNAVLLSGGGKKRQGRTHQFYERRDYFLA